MADVLCSFFKLFTSWERAFFELRFCFVVPLGFLVVFVKKVLMPKLCVRLQNN